MTIIQRKLPVGAEVVSGGVHFRVWAPSAPQVTVVLQDVLQEPSDPIGNSKQDEPMEFALQEEPGGYWSGLVSDARPGMVYRFNLGRKNQHYPDPVSRFQPEGPHGVSQIVDPAVYSWTDQEWRGIPVGNRVLYEMHIGTFTPEGTYRAAAEQLAELARLGITVIQLMPLAEFDGSFGWGYDGVDLFAPYHHYGTPDELRHFIDRAHNLGLGVILDVVYNHFGSSGCYLQEFSREYFSSAYKSEWGAALNFDGENCEPVREFVISNAVYWIREYHLDGFRLDATQQIFDASSEHIVAALVREARQAAGSKVLYVVAENEPQHCHLLRTDAQEGHGVDAILNDDFHHSATVALKGFREAYFTDYRGNPQEFISAVKYGFLYQGQWYSWQKQRRGTPTSGLSATAFVHFLQNHDQVANTGPGKRIHTFANAGLHRAFTALLLLGPAVPLLFQGQEFSASAPFLYFADHEPELAAQVRKGRTEFLHQFPSLAAREMENYLSRPDDPLTFGRSKLDFTEREKYAEVYKLHEDLLRLRREDPVFSQRELSGVDGAVLAADAFVLRFFSSTGADRLLLINMGRDLLLSPVPEPLLAPPWEREWRLTWSSEHPQYGGHGIVPQHQDHRWLLSGFSAVVLTPGKMGDKNNA